MIAIELLQEDVQELKGSVNFNYDFRMDGWIAIRTLRNGTEIRSIGDDKKAHKTIEEASTQLCVKLGIEL